MDHPLPERLMLTLKHWILDDDWNPVEVDLYTWARWLDHGHRVLACDKDESDPDKTITISTVFLGIDHNWNPYGPPVLWETMIFGGLLDQEMDRYTSKEAALAGHQAMCARVKASLTKGHV